MKLILIVMTISLLSVATYANTETCGKISTLGRAMGKWGNYSNFKLVGKSDNYQAWGADRGVIETAFGQNLTICIEMDADSLNIGYVTLKR